MWLWEELLVMVHAQDIEPDSSLGWHFPLAQLHGLAQLTYLRREWQRAEATQTKAMADCDQLHGC